MDGPLRIIKRPRAFGAGAQDSIQRYLERLVKLIPGEIVGLYLTVRGFLAAGIEEAEIAKDWFLLSWPWMCLVILLIERIWATRRSAGAPSIPWWRRTQWIAVGISAIAFVVWVGTLNHPMYFLTYPDPRIPPVLAVVFTFLVPMVWQGSPPSRPNGAIEQDGGR